MAAMTYSEYSALSDDERKTMFDNASKEDRVKIWDMVIANHEGDTSVLGPEKTLTQKKIVPVSNTNSMTSEEESIIDRDIEAKRISDIKENLGQIGVNRIMKDSTAKLGTPEYLDEPGLNPSFVRKAMLDANSRGDMRLTPNNLQNVANNLENRRGFDPNSYKAVGYQSEDHIPPIVTGPVKMGYQSVDHIPPTVKGNNRATGLENRRGFTPTSMPLNNLENRRGFDPNSYDSKYDPALLDRIDLYKSSAAYDQRGNMYPPQANNKSDIIPPLPFMERPDNMGVTPQGMVMTAGHPSAMAGTVPLPTSSVPQPRSIDRNNPNAAPQRPGYKVVKDGNNNPVKSGNGFMWSKDYQHKMWEN